MWIFFCFENKKNDDVINYNCFCIDWGLINVLNTKGKTWIPNGDSECGFYRLFDIRKSIFLFETNLERFLRFLERYPGLLLCFGSGSMFLLFPKIFMVQLVPIALILVG